MPSFIVLMPLSEPSRNLREKRGKVDYGIELELAQRGLGLGEVLVMPLLFQEKSSEAEHWKRLLRDIVESSSLETSRSPA